MHYICNHLGLFVDPLKIDKYIQIESAEIPRISIPSIMGVVMIDKANLLEKYSPNVCVRFFLIK